MPRRSRPQASPLNPERREDFVDLHPGQREFVFAAAERTLTTGTPLVIVGLPVEAAMWTSLITHLLLPTTAWSVPFSTYEGGSQPDARRTGFPLILGIPPEDAAAWQRIPADQRLVHDPAHTPVREPDGYRLRDGSLLPIGRWASLAEDVCRAGLENAVRAKVDELGVRVGATFDRWPLVGLAAAVLALPTTTLQQHQALAELAALVAIASLPSDRQCEGDVLGELVEAIFRWSPDALGSAERMLVTLDAGPEAGGLLVDRLLNGYLRGLLGAPDVVGSRNVWIPHRLRLSRAVADRLLMDLDDLIRWVDDVDHPVPRAKLVLLVAELAPRLGWLGGPGRTTVERVVGDRARTSVVPLIMGEGVRLGPGSWPPIPTWLWNDVLVDALQDRLPGCPVGSVPADPQLRRVVDDAAGPLPLRFVPGETLATLTMVDGERAAVLLALAAPQRPMAAAQVEVLRAAAFLRSVGTARGRTQVPPGALFAELRRWFPPPHPRAVVLLDLLEQLRGTVPVADLCRFVAAALESLPPDATTAEIVRQLKLSGAAVGDLLDTAAEWHGQFATPTARTSREVDQPTMPLSRPDYPETRLLDVVAADRLAPQLAEAGRRRLARWVLVLAAESLDLPGNTQARESWKWLAAASGEPLRSQLGLLYAATARALIAELDGARRSSPVAADMLAAEWVVRAQLLGMGVGGDPARSFSRRTTAGSAVGPTGCGRC